MVFSAPLHFNGLCRAILREGFLGRVFRGRFPGLMLAAWFGLLAPLCVADNNNRITLDTSETVFAVLTAINTCGYNVGLHISDAQRRKQQSDGGSRMIKEGA